jgi:hypothetical protein
MAGYSETPLVKKLGIREGFRVATVDAPPDYRRLLAPLPPAVKFIESATFSTSLVHVFVKNRQKLQRALFELRETLGPNSVVWVSWPKQNSGVASELTEDAVRAAALPLGFVDVKVCAVTEVWSGLKLVLRRELR